jgi:hypothetical protein
MFEVNLQQKLGSLLFNTVYYVNDNNVDSIQTAFTSILSARAAIQTQDVQYLSATATEVGTINPVTQALTLAFPQGTGTGATAPVANFLVFKLYHATGRYSTQRMRGYVVNELTEDTVFNLDYSGDVDPSQSTITGSVVTSYGIAIRAYLDTLVLNTTSRDGRLVSSYSTAVTSGYQSIRRSI